MSPTVSGQTDRKEKWFGTEYALEAIPPEWKKRWETDPISPVCRCW